RAPGARRDAARPRRSLPRQAAGLEGPLLHARAAQRPRCSPMISTRRKKQILIVDDSVLVLDVMRAALDAAGYEVLVANNLTQLEQHRLNHRPDLVLMDVQMPEAFGDG